jgi:hypothetical protein
VELLERPEDAEGSRVIVTFLPKAGPLDLRERGIDESQARQLRARFMPFRQDWDNPEMDVYDDL